ncbi:xanthine dehydrogenase family protein molybdopterin-binding subunit [Paludibaculum fermentans]|uniref:Xanthine dehydrogenase family protein molybdopterin-binding subunit n=1 Tax=Paludibaculum fermentans TaxID=1473598 RepID=A0A7S7SKI4_PALFE|nr:molybdopterin cofactor-binding domain-containing protein [Paludibaculum fermentans]QOY87758.1 xanthine dehydrogenase family protein molybdopterin-binding subunit [Paludibaculum fermentans]
MPDSTEWIASAEPERYELREPVHYEFHCDRRVFLQCAGIGLLITALSRAQSGPATTAGRIHLGEDGFVTVLSGKVEEGQGPRTEFAAATAEELRLPVDKVRVVLADTQLVPNDWLTAGSRSTPVTVPLVRRAAAEARALLLATAAERWKVDGSKLQIDAGVVKSPDGKQTMGYAELAKAGGHATRRAAELIPPIDRWPADESKLPVAKSGGDASGKTAGLTPQANWKTLGQPLVRVNARDIITGVHAYPSGIQRPGMLYGCVLRPPSYGATLDSVDLNTAKQLPGVVAVRDGEFAACAAPTSYAARKALAALAANAKWVAKPQISSDELYTHLKKPAGDRQPQVQERGSVKAGLQQANKKLSASYQVPYIAHSPMEPRTAVAEWTNGSLTVWTGTSNPFDVRDELAQAFHIDPSKVRVIVPDFGGGFGGKHTGEAALEAARLAKEAGKPVSLRWTRAEEFMWGYFRPAGVIDIEAGLDEKGQLTGWDFTNYNSGPSAIGSPYKLANTRTRFVYADSPLRSGSYRGLAATANNFARESFMDELAAAAGQDPLEFRLAHLENGRLRDVLVAAAERFGWQKRRKETKPNTGVGLACGTEKGSFVAACVEVELDRASGIPRLVEICEAFECGPVLNPKNLRLQVEGCILMGLGAALREEILFENGRLKNGSFARYRVPRFKDTPRIETVLVERKDLEPAGAGETPIMAVAPAMANAIFAMTGEPVRALPLRAKAGKPDSGSAAIR